MQLWVVEFVVEAGQRDWAVHESSQSPTDLTMMVLFNQAKVPHHTPTYA